MIQQKKTELILALDCDNKKLAIELLKEFKGELKWVKIGLQMFISEGLGFLDIVNSLGYNIFLDLKLHDIPNTVSKAIQSLAKAPIKMLTIHASGGYEMCKYSVDARNEHNPDLKLLAVTILTSMNERMLHLIGINNSIDEQVIKLSKSSLEQGIDGLVASPLEISILRKQFGYDPLIVTPGIRLDGNNKNEQKRILNPKEASELGASYIVIGRPILNSSNPLDTIKSINKLICN